MEVISIKPKQRGDRQVAIVSRAKEGKPLFITDVEGRCYQVAFVAASLAEVALGDRVRFEVENNGVHVLSKLVPIAEHQAPQSFKIIDENNLQLSFGLSKIYINKQGEVQIRNQSSEIKLTEQGDVYINGQSIKQTVA